jgi:hypothetical protein
MDHLEGAEMIPPLEYRVIMAEARIADIMNRLEALEDKDSFSRIRTLGDAATSGVTYINDDVEHTQTVGEEK